MSDQIPGLEGLDPLLGTTLAGRYEIEQKLGEGGMGTVYRARHVTLEKEVALKVLHGEFTRKPELVERFLQEARAASRIRHENVIDITDFGTTPQGVVFFAMELLEGRDLHDLLTRARLNQEIVPWTRLKPIFLQVCAALGAAHAKGIVHRDLKPENIFLVNWGGQTDFVKLLDFGIAKLTEIAARSEGERKLTKTGMIFGTPEFMAPEQARGEVADQRADVYALGCILYQMLCGKVPFIAETFMGILSKHMTDPIPPLCGTYPACGAPPAIESVVRKALTKDRDERFASTAELAQAVMDAERGLGVAISDAGAAPPWGGEQAEPDEITELAKRPTPERVAEPAVAAATVAGSPERPRRRTKTRWTGSAVLPAEVEAEPERRPSRAGWVAAGLILCAAGGGAAAFVVAQKGDVTGDETAAEAVTHDAGVAAAPATERVSLTLESEPPGARVVDLQSGETVGAGASIVYSVPRSAETRRFRLTLDGYHPVVLVVEPTESATYTIPLKAIDSDTEAGDPMEMVADSPASETGKRRARLREEPANHADPDGGAPVEPDPALEEPELVPIEPASDPNTDPDEGDEGDDGPELKGFPEP